MTAPSISSIMSGALRYAGDLRGEMVALPDVFAFYEDSRAELEADIQFSESFRQLQTAAVAPAGRDFALNVEDDFAFEVGVDFRAAGSQRWETLHVVAPERIADAEVQGLRRCSFYGEPRSMMLSFDPDGFEFQLRYVSTSAEEEDPEGETSFPAVYVAMLKLLTGHKILPHCDHDDAKYQRLMGVIQTELSIWQPRWKRFVERPLKREGQRAVGFRNLRRGRGRRDPRRYMVQG
jgi:hypothetical protein